MYIETAYQNERTHMCHYLPFVFHQLKKEKKQEGAFHPVL